jgi:hypothetical protein
MSGTGSNTQASAALVETRRRRVTVQRRSRLTLLVLAITFVVSLTVASGAEAAIPGWLGQEQVDPHNSALNTVSCSGPSYCVAGGIDLVVQDHAVRSDLSSQLSPETDEIAAISCVPGTTFCAVTDDSGGVYTLSGETLSARIQRAPAGVGFDSVSCPATTFCMAIDESGETFKYTGAWSAVQTLSSSAESDLQVSCVSNQFCVAAVPAAKPDEDYYKFSGTSWSGPFVLEATGAVETGLSCTSEAFCVAADTSDKTETFNGSKWTGQAQGSGASPNDQFNVSCAGTFCLADSFETGETFLTSDGTTWSPGANLQDPETGNGGGGPTSCTSSTMCVVVDLSGVANTYALPDTLATQPSLAGSAAVGGTINLTSGTPANADTSVVDLLQRCLGGCTPLPGKSYTTTAADNGASIEAFDTTGVGLDVEGPFAANAIGPISGPNTNSGGAGGAGGAGGGGTSPHPLAASISAAKVVGMSAHVTVSCPVASSASCPIKVLLAVTEKLSGRKLIGVSAHKRTTTRKVTLGTASATLQPGASRQLTVSLNAAGKRLLAARHALEVDLSVTQTTASPLTRRIEFRVPRKKHK